MRITRTRLVLLPLVVLALLAAPLPASAAGNCGTEVITSVLKGSLTAWYSPGCYSRATKLLTPDLRNYSDAGDVISTAARRDRLRKLKLAVAKKAPNSRISIRFTPAVGTIRVSVFAKRNGRFVLAALGSMKGTSGTLKAKLGKATRIRVSAGYVGSGDKPVTVSLTLTR
jgi:hypothetical protein